MTRAIVTGATGFISRALTEKLLAQGVRVYAVGRDKGKLDALRQLGAETYSAAFEDYGRLDEIIGAREAEVFYHCAFAGSFGGEALRDHSLQLENAKHACDAVVSALKMGLKRFVLASTVNTAELRSLLEDETVFPRYTCIYSTGKLAAELMGRTLARNGHMEFSTALIAMPYGEGNSARTLPNIVMEQLSEGVRPKLIEGKNLYDLVYIDDVAEGLTAIGERGRADRSYYIGHRVLKDFRTWITDMRDILAPDMELTFGEYPDAPALDYGYIDLDALYRDTGFSCHTDFRESIVKTAQWLEKQKSVGRTKAGGVTPSKAHCLVLAFPCVYARWSR